MATNTLDLETLGLTLIAKYWLANGWTLTSTTGWDRYEAERSDEDVLQLSAPLFFFRDREEGTGVQEELRLAFVTSNVMRMATTDADELAQKALDWNLELRQLQPGAFKADVTIVPLGHLLICRGRYNTTLLQRGTMPDDCITVSRPTRSSEPLLYRGHTIAENEVFVAGPSAEGFMVNRGLHVFTTISVRLDFLQSQPWLGDTLRAKRGAVTVYAPGADWGTEFLQSAEWLLDAIDCYPQALGTADVLGGMSDVLLARISTLGAAPISDDREMRAARRAAVMRAREYIDAHLTQPIRLSDLCEYARAQARSLEYGFREVLGISPMSYVRSMRLHNARRLLQSTAVRTRSTSDIAMDCGFWHLSQFSVDYKKFFAESPSVTHKRTVALLPRQRRSLSHLRARQRAVTQSFYR